MVWLKDFGTVKVFRTQLKDQLRHYAVSLADIEALNRFDHQRFTEQHDRHWQIEQYHRAIKQVCNIERFQVRGKQAIKNHVFAALYGYVQLQQLKALDVISNCYRLRRDLFNEVIASFISHFIGGRDRLVPQFQSSVNA